LGARKSDIVEVECIGGTCPDVAPWERVGMSELPTIARSSTFPGLSPPPPSREAQNWWLTLIVWDLIYSLSEPGFRISFQERYHYSSNFTECRYFTTFNWPHISVLRDPTVTWLGTLVVLHILCICWCDLDPIKGQGQGHGAFELRTISEAVCMLAAMTAAPLRGFLVLCCGTAAGTVFY